MEIKIYQNRVGVFPHGLMHLRKFNCGDGNVLDLLIKRLDYSDSDSDSDLDLDLDSSI